jgi:hypothetical protein
MEFREKVIEYREGASSVSSLSNKTDISFLEKYGNRGKGGEINFNGVFIPGNIYFFSYNTDSKIDEKTKFINRNPLVLYISSERVGNDVILKTIDLTITPPEQRLQILQSFWDKFSSVIESNQKRISRGEFPEEIRLTSKDLPRLFEGTGYNFSFRGFKLKFTEGVKPVDYGDWHKLPYLKYTLIQGISINEIYNDYRLKLKS